MPMKKREDGETLWVFREAKNSVRMKGTVILQRTLIITNLSLPPNREPEISRGSGLLLSQE